MFNASLPDLSEMQPFRYDAVGDHYVCGCIETQEYHRPSDDYFDVMAHTCRAHQVAWHRAYVAMLASWGRNHDADAYCPVGQSCPRIDEPQQSWPF